ncbi:AAA family ATPase [Microvirga sp. 3-52]|nr:AAA family ATPase [Microvirga sp. 3-52]
MTAGERRQITALFYDIVNSTSLLSSLDPEDYELGQHRIHGLVADIVERFDGYLDRSVGDGGLAFFGYPTSIESSAEAAVAAALEILQQGTTLGLTETGLSISMRIGIATGVVILRPRTASYPPGNVEATGLALNLAARLQTIAAPGTVAVAGNTYVLTHSLFDYQPLGTFDLKGFSESQRVWRPIARRQRHQRFLAYRRTDTPLLGREDELELLHSRWRLAQAGQGQLVFIEGEAGIGKSRLIFEFVHQVDPHYRGRHVFQCEPRRDARPFHAFIDAIQRDHESLTGNTNFADIAAVQKYLAITAPGTRKETADLIFLLLNPEAGITQERSEILEVDSDEFIQLALDAVIDVLAAWSALAPQILVFEDIHWADAHTRSLILRLANEVQHYPVLIVGATRTPILQNAQQNATVATLQLSRLTESVVPRLVAALWDAAHASDELVTFVEEKCDGVPLFIEELIHFLKTHVGEASSTRADWEHLLAQDGIGTIKDLLAVSMEMLGGSRRIAQLASVLGREFSYDLLFDMVTEESNLPISDHLDVLARHRVLYPVTDREPPTFRFRHALLQEAAYESLLKTERRQLHDKVVRLSSTNGRSLPDEVMAWHCEQAGRLAEAAGYAIKAAETAAAHWAMKEAESLLNTAESYLAHLPKDVDPVELNLKLLAARGPVATALYGSGSPQAQSIYEQGVQLCRENGLEDKDQWFSLYWGWWFTSPSFNVLVDRSAILTEDFKGTADREIELQHLHCSWATYFHVGRHQSCLSCIEQGLQLYDAGRARDSRVRYGGHDAKVCALAEQGLSLWFLGNPEAAVESLRRAQLWAEEINHLGSKCHALEIAITHEYFRDDYHEVIRLAEKMRAFSVEHDLPAWAAKSLIYDGWARGVMADAAAGLTQLEQGLTRQREIGTEEDLPIFLEMRARLLGLLGQFQEAINTLNQAIEHAIRTGDVFWLPELYRRRGLLHVQAQNGDALIKADLEAARDLAAQQGATMLEARAAADIKRFRELQSPGN